MALQTAGYDQTLVQQRAAQAWGYVKKAAKTPFAKKYRSLVRTFSSYILTNGLAAALAFLKAKGGEEHKELYEHIASWVGKQCGSEETTPDLLEMLLQKDVYTYAQATEETLVFVTWLKRFAEAAIEEPGASEEG